MPQILTWAALELLAEPSPSSFQMLNCIHSFGKHPDRELQSSHLWEEEVGEAEQCLCPGASAASMSPCPPVALLGMMQRQEVDAGLLRGLPASLCCLCQAGASFQ